MENGDEKVASSNYSLTSVSRAKQWTTASELIYEVITILSSANTLLPPMLLWPTLVLSGISYLLMTLNFSAMLIILIPN